MDWCKLFGHKWLYKTEYHRVKFRDDYIYEEAIAIRECKRCGERQHSLLPSRSGTTHLGKFIIRHWKKSNFDEFDILKAKKL